MITLDIIEGPNYERDENGWEHHSYRVTLRRGTRRLTTPWRQGLGITHDPRAEDVLASLMLDASSYVNAVNDFEGWCADFGYDTDSRKAYALYEECRKITNKLARFLGDDWDETSNEEAEDAARRLVTA